jgi:hypothetical protein
MEDSKRAPEGGFSSRESSLGVSLRAFLVDVAMSSAMGAAMIQTQSSSATILRLPAPEQKGKMSLEEALARRRSVMASSANTCS